MNRAVPRQRSPQPSDTVYRQSSTTQAPSSSPPPAPHPRAFAPTPPYTTTTFNPYDKPGFFLTPNQSLSQLHLPQSMWLWAGTRSHYVGLLVLVVCCVVVFSFVTNMRHPLDFASVDAAGGSFVTSRQQQQSAVGTEFDVHATLRPLIALDPTIATLSSLKVPTFYQRTNASLLATLSSHPQLLSHLQDTDHPTAFIGKAEKGLVILLHGCSHDGSDWFTLPEERRIVRLLLASGYSAISFTSANRDSGCWDTRWSADNVDVQRVIAALQSFITAHYDDGSHPPLFIMGASSGGTFTSILSRTLPTTAQCIIVSPGSDRALLSPAPQPTLHPYTNWSGAVLGSSEGLYTVPPTAWLYMVKDTQWASEGKISGLRDSIREKGKSLGLRIAKHTQSTLLLPVKQHPLTKTYMAERLDGWMGQPALAALFYKLAHREGFVDRYDYLIDRPRNSGMAKYMLEVMEREVEGDEMKAVVRSEEAAVGEELAVLWGEHEMTSEHMDEVVLWMERQRTGATR